MCENTQAPLVHAPLNECRDVFASRQALLDGHWTVLPPQVPLPSQASPVVQASPSLQVVVIGDGAYVQAPVAGVHVPGRS